MYNIPPTVVFINNFSGVNKEWRRDINYSVPGKRINEICGIKH
jgi:hypothetical protein